MIGAAIDIGTNSTRLLVARKQGEAWEPLHRDLQVTRLGQGLSRSGKLTPAAIGRTVAVAEAFAKKARGQGARFVSIAATHAAREAANGRALVQALRAQGLYGRILSGGEEAALSFRGVSAGLPGLKTRPLLVVDVGGGSTELIRGRENQVEALASLPVGAVQLAELCAAGDDPLTPEQQDQMKERVRQTLEGQDLAQWSFPKSLQVVAVGGTATSLVSVHLGLVVYDANRVHGSSLHRQEVERLRRELAALDLPERRQIQGLQPERADIIVPGALILEMVLDWCAREDLVVSEGDLLLGLLDEAAGPYRIG